MPPKYPQLFVSEPTKADKGSNLRDPLYNSLFDLSALRLGYEIFAQQLVQKIPAQVEFVPDDCFVIHIFVPPCSYIKCAIFNLVRKLN